MVWFRVDDGWHKHRKRIRTGLDLEGMAAQGLWAAAGSWCGDELADGFIPEDVVDYLAPGIGRQLAKRLEAAKLWVWTEQDGEAGWQFHQWVDQQPTREEVEAASSKKSSGGKLGNHRRWHTGEGSKFDPKCPFCREEKPAPDRRSEQTSNRSTDRISDRSPESGANPPTRPDPTRPDEPPSEVLFAATPEASPTTANQPRKQAAPRKATRIPDDFGISHELRTWAAEEIPGFDIDREHKRFRDYWRGAGGGQKATKSDWPATWRNWMRRANDERGGPNNAPYARRDDSKALTPYNSGIPRSTADERVADGIRLAQHFAEMDGQ